MAVNATVPPIHSKRVEAWVYTVLNPIIEGVRRELLLLGRGDLTWRACSHRCEYMRPIQQYLDESQLPNLEDFLCDPLNPQFKAEFKRHDLALSAVEGKAARFFTGLMNSELFRKEVGDFFREYAEKSSASAGRGIADMTNEELAKYVVEYLINNTGDLPAHYLTHGFWKEYRPRFPHLAEEFDPYKERQSFQDLQLAVVELKAISGSLSDRLEEHRRDLCARFDIPAAPWSNGRKAPDTGNAFS